MDEESRNSVFGTSYWDTRRQFARLHARPVLPVAALALLATCLSRASEPEANALETKVATGRLEFDKQLPLNLSAGADGTRDVLRLRSITVHKEGPWAEIRMTMLNDPKGRWLVNVILLDEAEEHEVSGVHGIIENVSRAVDRSVDVDDVLGMNLGRPRDLSLAKKFRVELRPTPMREPRKEIVVTPLVLDETVLLFSPWADPNGKRMPLAHIRFYQSDGRLRATLHWHLFFWFGTRQSTVVLTDDAERPVKAVTKVTEDGTWLLGEFLGKPSQTEIDFGPGKDVAGATKFYLDVRDLPVSTAKVRLEFNKQMPLKLACGIDRDEDTVQLPSVVLRKVDGLLRADVRTLLKSHPKGKWKVDFELRGTGGRFLERGGACVFDNSGTARGAPKRQEGDLRMPVMQLAKLQGILDANRGREDDVRFHIRLRRAPTGTEVTGEPFVPR